LGKLGDASAVPALIQALKDSDKDVCRNAAEVLGKIGKPAVPALIEAVKDSNEGVRRFAVVALGEIGDASAIPALIQALKDSKEDVRFYSVTALGKLGDASAVPALIQALKDSDKDVCRNAAEALKSMGDSTTLPRKILAAAHVLPQKRIEVLAALRRVHKDTKGTLKYDIPETRLLCQTVLDEGDAEACKGAQEVLDWLKEGMIFVRPSQPNTMSKPEELLRPTQGGTPNVQPDTLLREAQAPQGNTKQPSQRRTLRERLFGKRKDVGR
jgi:hypothetical protein